MNDKISKALHGVIRPGECWHENIVGHYDECINCGCAFQREDLEPYDCREANPDYFSKEGFVDLLEWATEQDWWSKFVCHTLDGKQITIKELFKHKTFAKHLHDFLVQENIISQGSQEA